ncbi:hypothetical protein GQ457_12G015440 [Hibiscus cannabinus]
MKLWKLREGENRLFGVARELSFGMARPRRGVRGGGQAPVNLDEVEIEQGNEETIPPLPQVGGEANEGAFHKKYLGTRYEDEKKREFMALVQGSMLVSDYEIQFVRLSQYVPELITSLVEARRQEDQGINFCSTPDFAMYDSMSLDDLFNSKLHTRSFFNLVPNRTWVQSDVDLTPDCDMVFSAAMVITIGC